MRRYGTYNAHCGSEGGQADVWQSITEQLVSPNLSPVVSVIPSHGSWKLGSSVWNVSARVHATLNLRAQVLSQYHNQVQRRWGSGNGGRRRMSLEAASYDSARWRPWCDGRMVIDIGVTVPYVSCQDVRSALFRGSTALSEWRREYKRFPKKADPNPTCPQTAVG